MSAASGWEIATKARLGKLPEAGDVPENLAGYLRKAGFLELSISMAHARLAGSLPGGHRDPFDRILAAQAQIEGLPVVTRDPEIAHLGASTVW